MTPSIFPDVTPGQHYEAAWLTDKTNHLMVVDVSEKFVYYDFRDFRGKRVTLEEFRQWITDGRISLIPSCSSLVRSSVAPSSELPASDAPVRSLQIEPALFKHEPQPRACPNCGGVGEVGIDEDSVYVDCDICDGLGYHPEDLPSEVIDVSYNQCRTCPRRSNMLDSRGLCLNCQDVVDALVGRLDAAISQIDMSELAKVLAEEQGEPPVSKEEAQ